MIKKVIKQWVGGGGGGVGGGSDIIQDGGEKWKSTSPSVSMENSPYTTDTDQAFNKQQTSHTSLSRINFIAS